MSKRNADDDISTICELPPKKVQFEPHLIGPISSLDELDNKVLKFQNKKLAERIEQRIRCEAELRQRIEQLEKRQTQDDIVLNVVNRYWNQLNEDFRILLQRFDAETADEAENKNENEVTTSFLTQLSTWDKEELDDKLANRVQVSKRAVAKVVQVIDRLMQRNEKFTMILKGQSDDNNLSVPDIEETLKGTQIEIMAENRNLQSLNTSLHEKYHTISLKLKELQDTLTGRETEVAELQNKKEELQYDLEKVGLRNDKLENHLSEAIEKLKSCQPNSSLYKSTTNVATQHLEDLQKEVEEYRELANNRLQELEKLHETHLEALKEVEKLKLDIRQLPESIIVETTEYKCLQSQFSVLYNESMQIKTMLDETRNQLQTSKNQHLRQIETMESEELIAQMKVRNEILHMEDVLAQFRSEYEILHIEYEQNLVANQQTVPIIREMRHLITSLHNHNGQLKGEVFRYKHKYKDAAAELKKIRKDYDDLIAQAQTDIKFERDVISMEDISSSTTNGIVSIKVENDIAVKAAFEQDGNQLEEIYGKMEKDACAKQGNYDTTPNAYLNSSKSAQKEKMPKESEMISNMKIQKALSDQKEVKLLLEMSKDIPKYQRDKVQLMTSEKSLCSETDVLVHRKKKIQSFKHEGRKKLADEDALQKIKQLEQKNYELQKQVVNSRNNGTHTFVGSPEEEALLREIEVTGRALEEIQEKNSHWIQQMSEKDDANFKLITERIRYNKMHKLLLEERQIFEDQVQTRDAQIEALRVVLRKLEEKECILQNNVTAMSNELMLRQQAMEIHKRKAIEATQSAADLKLHLEKYHFQMKEAQHIVTEKTSSLEAEAYKTKRLKEEVAQVRRKMERMKKVEITGTTIDEVMIEEIREYKEILTCTSCKTKRKDAVLSKCFHVFCYDCLRTRYETRQRKCPKCNCAFGANGYHRLYLSS
ncbi:E3 ubiquitin-protein ligase Bre1-like [Contarinia nasturtii]|uniref:E3 ubiquitin-protein ligase Bre1-like n=1 Tax=Contarinia nasturtii TaxID=265458 RepID=UPI0012D475CA|nr:E3 ubiquitin-protein ligase Bre1-like [Contarinia nasturtii]